MFPGSIVPLLALHEHLKKQRKSLEENIKKNGLPYPRPTPTNEPEKTIPHWIITLIFLILFFVGLYYFISTHNKGYHKGLAVEQVSNKDNH